MNIWGKMMVSAGGAVLATMLVGAVGITGDTSENDELCAIHGITVAGLVPDTGDPL